WDGVRLSVGGRGRREDEFRDAVAGHGVEEIDAASHVGGVEGAGLADRLGDERFSCEVHDGCDLVLGKDGFDLRTNSEVGVTENRAWRDGCTMAFLEIVERDDLVSAG